MRPIERFRVRWNDGYESFSQVCESVAELNACIQPILRRQTKAAEMERKTERKLKLEYHRKQVHAAACAAAQAQKHLEQIKEKFDEVAQGR